MRRRSVRKAWRNATPPLRNLPLDRLQGLALQERINQIGHDEPVERDRLLPRRGDGGSPGCVLRGDLAAAIDSQGEVLLQTNARTIGDIPSSCTPFAGRRPRRVTSADLVRCAAT